MCNNQTCPKQKECENFNIKGNKFIAWSFENGQFKCKEFMTKANDFLDMFQKIVNGEMK